MPHSGPNKLVLYLIMLIGFAAGYLYHSQIGGFEPSVEQIPKAGEEEFKALKGLKIDFKTLEDPRYASLQVFGELPVNPGAVGKRDPFAP